MLIAAAVIGIAVLGGGGWALMNKANANTDRGPNGAQPAGAPVAPAAITQEELALRIHEVGRMTDPNRDTDSTDYKQALVVLDSLAPLATNDTNRVRIELVRAEAFLLLDSVSRGCALLLDIEGRTNRTRDTLLIQRRRGLRSLCDGQ